VQRILPAEANSLENYRHIGAMLKRRIHRDTASIRPSEFPRHVCRSPHSEEVEMNDRAQATTLSERADALEEHIMHELEHIVTKSVLFNLADGKVTTDDGGVLMARNPGKYLLMKEDPRLPKMPAKPTLIDYFKMPVRVDLTFATERSARQEGRPRREGHYGLPPARHRGREFHQV
jgi:hypothetical protein